MFEDYDYEDYFEPGVIDQIVIDAIAKAKEQVKESIKINLEIEFNKNKVEKERLDQARKDLNNKTRNVSSREREVEKKERNMLQNFAKDFFKDIDMGIVVIDYDSHMGVKCNNCDDDRYIEVIDIFNRQHKVSCSCNVRTKTWKYKEPLNATIRVHKDWSVLKKYTSVTFEEGDGYEYSMSFNNDAIYNSLEEFKEYASDRSNFYHTLIINKEVAQQCADYLNSREDL